MSAGEQNLQDLSLLDLFRQEVAGQTAVLTDSLLALEHQAADQPQLEILMRAAHSLKGAARIVGLDIAVKIAHALEDVFVCAQHGQISITSERTDLLLQGVDFLLKISKYPDNEMTAGLAALQPAAEKLLQDLADLKTAPPPPLSGEAKPQPPAPASAEPEKSAPKPEAPARSVRVSAAHLNRMLGLVDESIVQMRWLEPFIRQLYTLKTRQSDLGRRLENLRSRLENNADQAGLKPQINDICLAAGECFSAAAAHYQEIDDFSRRTEDLFDRLYRETLASRMRPFGDCAQGFPRMMRDLARQLGKKTRFEITGPETKVDREILDKLEAPLAHLLRNALDHGLETPEQRHAAGKPAEGLITLTACHHVGWLHITVADDGQGIDLEAIRKKIVASGRSPAATAGSLSEQEVLNFLFLPGFSTAPALTEISGRGVGLDIVLNLAQELGGRARIENRRPNGAAFHLQLPLTLSLVRALLVEIAGQPFALPAARITRLITAAPEATTMLEGKRYLQQDGLKIGLIAAAEALEMPAGGGNAARWAIVVLNNQASHYGLIVDRFLGESMIAVRALDARLGKVQDVSAVTLLEDGTPAIILDVDDLLRSVDRRLAGGGLKTAAPAEIAARGKRRRVLVADDSPTVRELERQMLRQWGCEVDLAVDGMEAWHNLRAGQYDLLVSDIDMPRLNGIELVRRIRQDARLRRLPVIVVSYKDRAEDRRRGLEAGANQYLTKSSFQDDTFRKTVRDLIGEGK